ncbi:hypothetical protein ABZ860_37600 [Microbispora sp. NPDC046973]|uniref:hypothetical protein n=1 Tax=Microbispora sp. NPDC046973 TaxID=3155022 RepID=UPI0033EB7512
MIAAAVFALTAGEQFLAVGDLSLGAGLHIPVDAGIIAAFLRRRARAPAGTAARYFPSFSRHACRSRPRVRVIPAVAAPPVK